MSDKVFKVVWTCDSDKEEHEMDTEEVSSLEELKNNYSYLHHDNCLICVDYNDYYEGSVDRIEVHEDGEHVETIDPETMLDGDTWED